MLKLLEQLLALLLDEQHFCLEGLLVRVGRNLILFGVASSVNVFLQLGFTLGNVQLVEAGLQVVDLFLLWSLFVMGYFAHTIQYGFLRVVLLAFGFHIACRTCLFGGKYVLFYILRVCCRREDCILLLDGSVYLRVHHLNRFSE